MHIELIKQIIFVLMSAWSLNCAVIFTPWPQVIFTPWPQVICTPWPQVICTPWPQVICTPWPQVIFIPWPQVICTPWPQVIFTPWPQVICTPWPKVICTPWPQVIFTPCLPHEHIARLLVWTPGEGGAIRKDSVSVVLLVSVHSLTLFILSSWKTRTVKGCTNEQQYIGEQGQRSKVQRKEKMADPRQCSSLPRPPDHRGAPSGWVGSEGRCWTLL